MKITLLRVFFLVPCLVTASEGEEAREHEWVAYNKELQIKAFTGVLTYEKAKIFCAQQGHGNVIGSMVMIKESGMQNFVANYTQDIVDHIWLGGRYDSASSQFKWDDGDPLTYSNWQTGYPKNITNSETCMELPPNDVGTLAQNRGKWTQVNCRRRNLVMCQKYTPWTLSSAVNQILEIRNDVENEKKKLEDAVKQMLIIRNEVEEEKQRREEAEKILNNMAAAIVPVGSIYVEYYNQTSPEILWPVFRWEDVTSEYGGQFFRAFGNGSESWGITQTECAPRIEEMQFQFQKNGTTVVKNNPLIIPSVGWSEFGFAGEAWLSGDRYFEALRFKTADCEVRPKNQAVRIWRRIA